MSEFKLYRVKLKSRKQIMAEIPREQQGWWADVCAGKTLTLRDATVADVARCIINEGQSRDPADYLCEACERGSLVRRIAIKELTEIPDRRATPPSPTAAPIAEGERAAFEVWYASRHDAVDFTRRPDDDQYDDWDIALQWNAWQARAALAAKPAAPRGAAPADQQADSRDAALRFGS